MAYDADRQVQIDSIFRIASMTKPITVVAVMMLYEAGHFSLDTPISAFIPSFKTMQILTHKDNLETNLAVAHTAITIRHLLTHTAGLSYNDDEGDFLGRKYEEAFLALEKTTDKLTLGQWVNTIATLPLANEPGTAWRYGFSIDVLAHLVEIISGLPFDQYLQERIFAPLQMKDTAFHVPPEKAHRIASVHRYFADEDRLERGDFPWLRIPQEAPSYIEGGNHLVSTAPDYAHFAQMLLNKGEWQGVRLLKPETIDLIRQNHLTTKVLHNGFIDPRFPRNESYGFGLGMRVLMDNRQPGGIGSFGWDGLYGTVFWVDPKNGLFGLMMIQQFGPPHQEIRQNFQTIVYQALA
ncbi:MAG: serine hydrolase domain-containing protein [Chloroflexota bacterium]